MITALGAQPVRVLIVEDNRDICGNIATYLEKHNYVLDFAYDGISAMHLALSNKYDVIVLDLMLPRMDGLSFCHRLRADADVETPVLMLTARDAAGGITTKRIWPGPGYRSTAVRAQWLVVFIARR
ncbi:response regulator [Pseudohongiella nitratireducens]|uniref:response regulator n=1 Tax=Pseudohongiella nitratireducens TaxID=1768907 RepID=UPI0030EC8CF4